MSRPHINETVHYVSYGSADGRYKSTCRAAMVTETHLDQNPPTVGLVIFSPNGMHFDRYVRESDEHTGGTWHWTCTTDDSEEEA